MIGACAILQYIAGGVLARSMAILRKMRRGWGERIGTSTNITIEYGNPAISAISADLADLSC